MYSFGPIPRQRRSGRIVGTHQKIDRIARRRLEQYLSPAVPFPSIKEILHFEGSRGPDGIKIKSPGRDESRHFIDPANITADDPLLGMIRNHSSNLTTALQNGNSERAAFEASWLAHAVTDGLTPAHHDLLDEQVKDLRASDHRAAKFRSRVVMTGGGSGKQFIKNNWQYWGAKGVMTTHALFEGGVATTVQSKSFKEVHVLSDDLKRLQHDGFEAIYIEMIRQVDSWQMYQRFKDSGWTHDLAVQTVKQLLPIIICAVTLAWYDAYIRALPKDRKKI